MLWRDNKGKNQNIEDKQPDKVISPTERASQLIAKMEALNSDLDDFKKQSAALAEELRVAQESVKAKPRTDKPAEPEGEGDSGISIIEAVKMELEEEAKAEAVSSEMSDEEARAELEQKRQELETKSAERKALRAEIKEKQAQQRRLIEARKKAEQEAVQKHAEELRRKAEEKARLQAEAKARAAEEKARKEAEETQRKLEEVRIKAEEEAKKKAEAARLKAEAANKKAEAARIKAEEDRKRHDAIRQERRRKKQERQLLIDQQRELQKRRRDEVRAKEKQLRKELSDLKKAERNELKRQRKIAEKSAEMGGGIVNVHGTTVKTEIRPVAKYSLRDLIGASKNKMRRNAASEQEYLEKLERAEQRKNAARQISAQLSQLRWERRRNSALGRRALAVAGFCEKHKRPLLVAFSIILCLGVGAAGLFNYYTVYEYSYNGKTLGYVKNKDTVLRITDMIQDALTADTDMDVVIDARDDIKFDRQLTLGQNVTPDSADDVLKRLTYMGNLNVKAYGIFVNGKKVGAVEDKETAAKVLQDIEDKYKSKKKGSEITEAVTIEDVQVRLSNTNLEDVMNEDSMVNHLCRKTDKETIHTVAAGETIADIAKAYNMDEESLLKANEGVDPQKLEAGSTIIIKERAPLITVQLTEVRTYEETIKYETEKQKDKEMYRGDQEVLQEGKNGLNEVTDKTTTVNGELVDTENLETIVKKEPTKKIVKVGTKKRPPTVGSKKYIWPAADGTYTVTSEFKWRWGRQHQGIDMGCGIGTDVLAADGGTVTFAGYMGGYGNLVIIDHQNGHQTYYGHNSSLCVKAGDKVYQGYHIAESGNTGRSTGPHIHFGLMVDGTFINPREYLPAR